MKRIVPDYDVPAALMVPHYACTIDGVLETIANAAALHIGVILLSGDPAASRTLVANHPLPDHFSIIAAPFDTPWIRDRSPIPVSGADGVRWVLPRMNMAGRDQDTVLFGAISVKESEPCGLLIAQGNLVAGPGGIALSSSQILSDNGLDEVAQLVPYQAQLGIEHWIVFEPFLEEQTRHADVHARFLNDGLLALAWNTGSAHDRAVARNIEVQVRAVLPDITVLRIPMRTEGVHYASPVNWIQIEHQLLVPRFPQTPAEDSVLIGELLHAHGFDVVFIDSPTTEFGGSLHCLTASIYV